MDVRAVAVGFSGMSKRTCSCVLLPARCSGCGLLDTRALLPTGAMTSGGVCPGQYWTWRPLPASSLPGCTWRLATGLCTWGSEHASLMEFAEQFDSPSVRACSSSHRQRSQDPTYCHRTLMSR
jgi:hypothetical protein